MGIVEILEQNSGGEAGFASGSGGMNDSELLKRITSQLPNTVYPLTASGGFSNRRLSSCLRLQNFNGRKIFKKYLTARSTTAFLVHRR